MKDVEWGKGFMGSIGGRKGIEIEGGWVFFI